MDAITQWIANGTPYEEGIRIYANLPSHNKILLRNFQKKQSEVLSEKLKYELEKYLNEITYIPKKQNTVILPPKITAPEVIVPKATFVQHIELSTLTSAKKQAIYFHELPEELRPVLLQANALFKEMCFLKVELNELPEHAEKKAIEIQLQIDKNQKENANCWTKIDYWQTHKISPKMEVSEFSKLSPAELLRKEQYLFASISKLNKRLVDNRAQLLTTTSLKEHNRISRAIEKQEGNLIVKNDELLTIKRLIHGN
jgi:hypothetical protein